jgi:adenosylcobyric acid synthase
MTLKTAACLMIQGAGSNVGKSVLVAGLCRHFANQGLAVAPFKPQNMSNNAAVTDDGGEIGRAQALQARAARLPASVHMNPVLLKPESETGSQIILQGKRYGSMRAREYGSHKAALLPHVLDSFHHLCAQADLVIVEGAGSPAEINLRAGDIANMGFASAVDVPVIMVGDIDRGGVIAALAGTDLVLSPEDKTLIKGFIINKFRGDTNLFSEGMTAIESFTGWAGIGILPYFDAARFLPAEDILDIDSKTAKALTNANKVLKIAVPMLRRIANFDDLDPLAAEPDVEIALIKPGAPIPDDCQLVLLPGSKATIADLRFLRDQGWDIDIIAHYRRGGHILGLCGGYQMLGKTISDPYGIEGAAETVNGLGLLEIETSLDHSKTLRQTNAVVMGRDIPVRGYEIHMGVSTGPGRDRPFLSIDGRGEGAISPDGRVIGSYCHGLFTSNEFRRHYLGGLGVISDRLDYDAQIDAVLDQLASHMADHLDLTALGKIAGI